MGVAGAGPGGARTPGGHSAGDGRRAGAPPPGHCASAASLRPHPEITPEPFWDGDLPFRHSLLREEAEGHVAQPWSDGLRRWAALGWRAGRAAWSPPGAEAPQPPDGQPTPPPHRPCCNAGDRPSLLRAPGRPAARCEGSSREEGRRAAPDRAPSGEHEALGAATRRVEGTLCTQPSAPAQRPRSGGWAAVSPVVGEATSPASSHPTGCS